MAASLFAEFGVGITPNVETFNTMPLGESLAESTADVCGLNSLSLNTPMKSHEDFSFLQLWMTSFGTAGCSRLDASAAEGCCLGYVYIYIYITIYIYIYVHVYVIYVLQHRLYKVVLLQGGWPPKHKCIVTVICCYRQAGRALSGDAYPTYPILLLERMLAAARNGDTAAAEIWYTRAQGAEVLPRFPFRMTPLLQRSTYSGTNTDHLCLGFESIQGTDI